MLFNPPKTRICLVNPLLEGPYPPLGLAYLAAYLKKYGRYDYEIRIIDGNCSKNIIDDIKEFNPDLVGFTALSPQIYDAVELCREIKSERPNVFQIIGGIHVSAEPEQPLRKAGFDLAVLGEGEQTFLEVVDSFVIRGKEEKFYTDIKGIAFLNKERLIINPAREEIGVLDDIPAPERALLDTGHYLSKYLIIRGLTGDRVVTIHTSRGCPYKCVFCSCGIVFKKVRYFSVNYVISEIKQLVDRYQGRSLFFTDDTFIVNKTRVRELCFGLLKEGINKKIKWEVQGRADLIDWQDLPLLKLMKKAGCCQIDYGFETGSDEILKLLKRDEASVDFNRRAIKVTKAAGLNVMGTFMVGVPGEKEESLELTKKFVQANYDEIDNFQVFIATPYPGAELYDICKRKGLVKEDYFQQLLREKEKGFLPIYTDTLSCEQLYRAFNYLNKLSLRKIKLLDKWRWMISNLRMNPLKTLRKVAAVIKK